MGWVLSFRFPRSAAVCRKFFVFSSLPIRKVLVLPFREAPKSKASLCLSLRSKGHYLCSFVSKTSPPPPPPLVLVPNLLNLAHGQVMLGSYLGIVALALLAVLLGIPIAAAQTFDEAAIDATGTIEGHWTFIVSKAPTRREQEWPSLNSEPNCWSTSGMS